jgi:hypothetical protein
MEEVRRPPQSVGEAEEARGVRGPGDFVWPTSSPILSGVHSSNSGYTARRVVNFKRPRASHTVVSEMSPARRAGRQNECADAGSAGKRQRFEGVARTA